jgi:hypothetical protein
MKSIKNKHTQTEISIENKHQKLKTHKNIA